VLIILLTVNDLMLPLTVVSRCQRIELLPVPAYTIEQALVEHWQVETEKARVLSRICRGAIGWAVSAALDESLIEERALRLAELQGLADASLEKRFEFAASLATKFSKSRDSVNEMLMLWLEWWRDLLLVREKCEQFITNSGQEPALHRNAEGYSLTAIRNFIEAIREALGQLESNANPRLALEVLMLSIPTKAEERSELPAFR